MKTKASLLGTIDRAWAVESAFAHAALSKLELIPAEMMGFDPKATYLSQSQGNYALYTVEDGAAIIDVSGVLMRKPSSADVWFDGASSTTLLRKAVRHAAISKEVESIALIIDSPGGQCSGTPELADEIRAASASKKVTAYVDGGAFSAAYWLACAADEIVCSPYGEVGSIGVFAVLYDTTGHAEKLGVKPVLLSSGGIKGEGGYGQELSEEFVEECRDHVLLWYDRFTQYVADRRGMDLDAVLAVADGRTFTADDALKLGLIDRIARWEQVGESAESAGQMAASKAEAPGDQQTEMKLLTRLFGGNGKEAEPVAATEPVATMSADDARVGVLAQQVIEAHVTREIGAFSNVPPAAREHAAQVFVAALCADGDGGYPALDESGQVVEGEATASVRALLGAFQKPATLSGPKLTSTPVSAVVIPDLSDEAKEKDEAKASYRAKALGDKK